MRSDDDHPDEKNGAVGEALGVFVQTLMSRGRSGLERWAHEGKQRMELRQLRRDRDTMFSKLGREARALLEGGEIEHAGLRRGVARLEELEARIAAMSEAAPAAEE